MSKRFLVFAGGLIAAILFLGTMFMVANKGKSGADNTMKQYDVLASQYDDVRYSIYDDGSASGNDIVNLIKNVSNDGVSIVVTNGSGTAKTYTYASVKSETSTVTADIKDRTKTESFINPTASFTSEVKRDANDVITEVRFTQNK